MPAIQSVVGCVFRQSPMLESVRYASNSWAAAGWGQDEPGISLLVVAWWGGWTRQLPSVPGSVGSAEVFL